MQRLLSLWNSLFWPSRRRQSQDDKQRGGGRFGRRELVLPRGRLIYKRFDLSELPAARRAQALALKLDAWKPVENARFWHGWHAGVAHVWSWADDDPVCRVQANENVVPESALHEPLTAGNRLVRVSDGFEAQIWRDGQLLHSRWWARVPVQAEWTRFLRAGGQSATPMPEPFEASWTFGPWLKSSSGGYAWWSAYEREIVTAVAAVLLLAIGWQAGKLWQINGEVQQGEQRLAELRSTAAAELAARERALGFADQAARMLDLIPEPRALELLDQVTAALPSDGRLLEWQHELSNLSLLFEDDTPPNPEQAIRAMQQLDVLDQIIAERGSPPNSLRMEARIESRQNAQ